MISMLVGSIVPQAKLNLKSFGIYGVDFYIYAHYPIQICCDIKYTAFSRRRKTDLVVIVIY